MKRDKKGETSVLTYIIAIVLLLVLAFFVIMAMSGNFGNFSNFVGNIFGVKVNVANVVNGCQAACASPSGYYDYCQRKDTSRKIYFTDDKNDPRYTNNGKIFACFELEGMNVGLEHCNNLDCSGAPLTPTTPTTPTTPPTPAKA